MDTALPLILPPVQRQPRAVCMSKAKSSTVAPALSFLSSPLGVKTKTSELLGDGSSSSPSWSEGERDALFPCSRASLTAFSQLATVSSLLIPL